MKLTDHEVEIVRLRDTESLSWSQIADRLGTTRSSVNSSYRAAKRKEAAPPKPRASTTEVAKPEEAAALIDAATSPFATVLQAAKACGFPPTTARRIMQRLQARYAPLNDAIRKVKREELINLFDDRAQRCLFYMDDFSMAGAAVKDLAISAGIMVDKARLLKGEPTTIYRHEDVRKLDELGAALMKEMKRRGITIDGETVDDREGS
ncbi:MAG: sigma factor-like helix-turn-helix DNA-binding protein [Alphaproteobacteria bacterium]|nr:sigma factor-like helix-turn-helix DNA-binding protein [Alphaproteobacteria bacterium]